MQPIKLTGGSTVEHLVGLNPSLGLRWGSVKVGNIFMFCWFCFLREDDKTTQYMKAGKNLVETTKFLELFMEQ